MLFQKISLQYLVKYWWNMLYRIATYTCAKLHSFQKSGQHLRDLRFELALLHRVADFCPKWSLGCHFPLLQKRQRFPVFILITKIAKHIFPSPWNAISCRGHMQTCHSLFPRLRSSSPRHTALWPSSSFYLRWKPDGRRFVRPLEHIVVDRSW